MLTPALHQAQTQTSRSLFLKFQRLNSYLFEKNLVKDISFIYFIALPDSAQGSFLVLLGIKPEQSAKQAP